MSWPGLALATAALGGQALWRGPPVVWLLATLPALLIARTALWRERLGSNEPLAGSAARLSQVWLLMGLFIAVLGLLLFVALLSLAYAVASAGHGFDARQVSTWAGAIEPKGRLTLGAGAALGFIGMAYAAAKISLAEAATLAARRVQVLSAWPLSRGALAAIVTGNILLAAPLIASGLWGAAPPYWRVLQGLAAGGVWLPMNVGLMAYVFANRTAQKAD